MNKVFSYAKIAGICFTVLFVLQLAISLLKMNSPIFNVAIEFVYDALWVVFFILLINSSAKQSPIVPPSWIAILGFIFAFTMTCISSYASNLITKGSDDWDTISNFFTVSNALYYIESVAIAVAFFWLSKYFSKGSALKVLAIIIAVMAILRPISGFVIKPWEIDNESTRLTVQICVNVFWILAAFVPSILFFFDFSKLKK